MSLVSRWLLKSNSNDAVSWYNGTDTSITYSATWPTNWSAWYNSSSDQISVWNQSAFNTTTWSIEAWVYTSISWNYAYIMCKNDNTVPNDNFYIAIWPNSNNGKVAFYNGAWRDSTTAINDSKWHHIMLCANGSWTDVYIDWRLDVTHAQNMFINTGGWANLYIWARAFDARNLSGNIAMAGFYNDKKNSAYVKTQYALYKWFM